MMKKIKLLLIAAVAMIFSAQAQELPAPSPFGKVMQRIGLTDVSIEYSRPGVKGRIIFGNLLPVDKLWRTGANAATKITFSTDATIGGKAVKAGTYSIFTKLGGDHWTLLLNSDVKASEGTYDAAKNVAEIELKVKKVNTNEETMTFTFDNVKTNSADLHFAWEKARWSVPIEVESKEMAMQNIQNKMKEKNVSAATYNAAANYYFNNNIDLDKALEWSKKSVDMDPKFYTVMTLSKIYAAKGDKKNAILAAKQSKALAKEAGNDDYVKMNDDNIAKWSKK